MVRGANSVKSGLLDIRTCGDISVATSHSTLPHSECLKKKNKEEEEEKWGESKVNQIDSPSSEVWGSGKTEYNLNCMIQGKRESHQ